MRFLDDPPRPLFQRVFYESVKLVTRILSVALYRIRVVGLENYPQKGGMLICSNHQSNLDPLMIGVCLPRHGNFVGKKELFNSPLLRWALKMLDTIPINREANAISGMKEMLRRLKRNETVVLFPEGKRTRDGQLNPLKTGFVAIAKRINCPVLPMAIDGTFQSWPANQRLPIPGHVIVVFGKPIPQRELASLSDDDAKALLSARMAKCLAIARAMHDQAQGKQA